MLVYVSSVFHGFQNAADCDRLYSSPFSLDVGEFSVKLRKRMSGPHKPFCVVGNIDADYDGNLDGEEQDDEGAVVRVLCATCGACLVQRVAACVL